MSYATLFVKRTRDTRIFSPPEYIGMSYATLFVKRTRDTRIFSPPDCIGMSYATSFILRCKAKEKIKTTKLFWLNYYH
jgi:hypothetical protein